MEKRVQFRDYQEQQAADHNDLQDFARKSFDDLVHDAVTASRQFAGFNTLKTAQTEVQVAVGRFYDVDGAVYFLDTITVQSLVANLAASGQRYVTLAVNGTEVETDTEERDFLTDVDTGATEPRAVATTLTRQAVLSFINGAQSADPQPPVLSVGMVRVADILVDTIQVVSVTMNTADQVQSLQSINQRTQVIEAFDAQIGPRVNSLASDLADLSNRIKNMASGNSLRDVYLDLARVKAALRFPSLAANYGTDFFLDTSQSDILDTFAVGYDAKVEYGIRFPDANADEFEISLFSANDPNAMLSNGVLLPKFTEEVKLMTSDVLSQSLGISQYGFQTVTMKQGEMSRSRLRYGGSYVVCTNGNYSNTPGQPNDLSNLYDVTSTEFAAVSALDFSYGVGHERTYTDYWWLDTWEEPFLYAVTTDHVITGAMVWQSWLQSNDIWLTKVGFYITAKAAAEDIKITLCELTNGVPDLTKAMTVLTYDQADIVIGWNRIATPYMFLQKGKRYAMVMMANANHSIGLADGNGYLNGTFGYSTDGAYFQGDLTKDLMMEIWGARFSAAQVTIEFAPINLDGGFRDIDILANMWVPDSCQFFWEVRPSGAGDWLPLVKDLGAALSAAPVLAQFRGRFVGTQDVAPGITLTGSRVKVSRPKLAFTHVSQNINLPVSSSEIHVLVTLENFDDTPHDHGCTIHTGSTHATVETADTVTTKLLDSTAKRYQREYIFNLGAPITDFIIVETGTTTSAANTYHVAERDFYTV